MTAREWMKLALRVLGVWFAALTFAAIVDLLATFLYVFYLLVRFGGSEFATIVAQTGAPLVAVLKYGVPAAVLLVFATQITQRLCGDSDNPPQTKG